MKADKAELLRQKITEHKTAAKSAHIRGEIPVTILHMLPNADSITEKTVNANTPTVSFKIREPCLPGMSVAKSEKLVILKRMQVLIIINAKSEKHSTDIMTPKKPALP